MVQNHNDKFDSARPPARSTGEFLEQIRGLMRMRRFILNTEEAYLYYIRRYIMFRRRRLGTTGPAEVESFLTHLAAHEHVSAAA